MLHSKYPLRKVTIYALICICKGWKLFGSLLTKQLHDQIHLYVYGPFFLKKNV